MVHVCEVDGAGSLRTSGEGAGKKLAPLSDNLVLLESGLDSLCLAIIVARLEDALGVDPFRTAEDGRLPLTVGDFVQFYEHAAS
jgi:acyl carrier protein